MRKLFKKGMPLLMAGLLLVESVVPMFATVTEKQVITILRATHKYKYSREQFEVRTHKRLIEIVGPTPETIDALSRLDLPSGVDIEIKL